jgi:hypothetical protein
MHPATSPRRPPRDATAQPQRFGLPAVRGERAIRPLIHSVRLTAAATLLAALASCGGGGGSSGSVALPGVQVTPSTGAAATPQAC